MTDIKSRSDEAKNYLRSLLDDPDVIIDVCNIDVDRTPIYNDGSRYRYRKIVGYTKEAYTVRVSAHKPGKVWDDSEGWEVDRER